MNTLDLNPKATPETIRFWNAVDVGELWLPKCMDCDRYFFPPSFLCPHCTSRGVEWFAVSGRATLYSYVIAQRPLAEWNANGPMSVALVQLAEGPRLVSTVVDCEQTPAALVLDMSLVATFRDFGQRQLLCFKRGAP